MRCESGIVNEFVTVITESTYSRQPHLRILVAEANMFSVWGYLMRLLHLALLRLLIQKPGSIYHSMELRLSAIAFV